MFLILLVISLTLRVEQQAAPGPEDPGAEDPGAEGAIEEKIDLSPRDPIDQRELEDISQFHILH